MYAAKRILVKRPCFRHHCLGCSSRRACSCRRRQEAASGSVKPVTETLWGRKVTDNYRYMEALDPATIAWMKARRAHALGTRCDRTVGAPQDGCREVHRQLRADTATLRSADGRSTRSARPARTTSISSCVTALAYARSSTLRRCVRRTATSLSPSTIFSPRRMAARSRSVSPRADPRTLR